MKNLFVSLLTVILLLIGNNMQAQKTFDHFQKLNYDRILASLDDQVDIQINRKNQLAGKQKVLSILKEKFTEFNPQSWELIHKGEADEAGNSYFIAKIYNSEEKGLRLFVHLERKDSVDKITSIKFRKLL